MRKIMIAVVALGCVSACSKKADGPMVNLVGDRIEFEGKVNFTSGQDTILQASYPLLNSISTLLKGRKDITRVKVGGHTDATGEAEFNMDLSERRAAAVVQYLRDKDVKQEIDAQGFGSTVLMCEEETAECNKKNRRVEFSVEM